MHRSIGSIFSRLRRRFNERVSLFARAKLKSDIRSITHEVYIKCTRKQKRSFKLKLKSKHKREKAIYRLFHKDQHYTKLRHSGTDVLKLSDIRMQILSSMQSGSMTIRRYIRMRAARVTWRSLHALHRIVLRICKKKLKKIYVHSGTIHAPRLQQ